MRLKRITTSLMLLFLGFVSLVGAQTMAINEAEFKKLHREVVPKKTALWETIPWEVDILEAKRKAEESGRLIFMWSMDGHPMGCV